MGSHTDYNDGFVLTAPIDRDTWIAASPRNDHHVRVLSLNGNAYAEFALDGGTIEQAAWQTYVQGVLLTLGQAGFACPGFDAVIHGTIPLASGLSSSASLEAATAVLCMELGRHRIDPVQLARYCQQAENEVVGVNCGILDQYSSLRGQADHALLLDCRDLSCRQVAIPEALGIVICDTRVPRQLSNSAYGERRAACEAGVSSLADALPEARIKALRDVTWEQFNATSGRLTPAVARRCQFVIEENQRVLDMSAAVGTDDRDRIGRLCCDSFRGARKLYEITVPAMDAMFAAMTSAPGVVGARQAGAGFGGCMVAVVVRASAERFVAHVRAAYERATGVEADVFSVEIAAGAGKIDF
jgi:galactokinase